MLIDAHHHLWTLGDPGLDWLDGDGLAPIRRSFGPGDAERVLGACGIGASILVEARSSADETEQMLAIAADPATLPVAVVGWVDVLGDVPAQVAALRTRPGGDRLVGIRHQIQGEDGDWLGRDEVRRGIAAVAAEGLVFDLVVRPDQLPACAAAAAALDEVSFVLDHLGKPPIATGGAQLDRWHDDLAVLAEHPHVAAKISGLATEADWADWADDDLAPVIDTAVDAFGADRILLGSDWPVCELAADAVTTLDAIRRLVAARVPEPSAFLGDNAVRLYGLGPLLDT